MSKLHSLGRFGMALAILSPALFAQEQESLTASINLQVTQELSQWASEHGQSWQTYSDAQTGYAQFLFGGSAPAAFEPESDADYEDLGRLAIEATAGMHGIEGGTLVSDRSLHLPLGLMGSNDKFTVRYRQEVNGVPVLGGFVNTLFNTAGELLSVQSSAMPEVASMSTVPTIGGDTAENTALAAFQKELGVPGSLEAKAALAIGQLEVDMKTRTATLVWDVTVTWTGRDMTPEGERYWVDAHTGQIVRQETTIHHFDVGGTVNTMASPGILPDQSNNPEVPFPLNHARVTGQGAGTVITDQNGDFNFPGVTGPLNVTFEYFGDWVDVRNSNGSDYTLAQSLTGAGNAVTMNSGTAAAVTSQSSVYESISSQRDWIRNVNPSDNTGDFRAVANVNIASTCNAFFNGSSVNFYPAGGGCSATSYSTVSTHEMGHWYNVLYGTGNGSDGIGEGNADVFSLYIYNTPNLGMDFQGQGAGPLRSGNNNLQFCGDNNPGCYGAVHTDGQVWMGAAWKIYKQLETSLGAAQADMVSDAIFMGWMNSYNQTQIKSVIETQWLTLDDDNGNIDDGTPNYNAIDAGFRQQGFPGYDLPLIGVTNLTLLGTQNSEVGPYVVSVDAASLIGGNITGVQLFYKVNNGSFTPINMSLGGGTTYNAGIPGQVSPAYVSYYVRASDNGGNTQDGPAGGAAEAHVFVIGNITTFASEDFENGEAGWTHGTFGDTSNSQDDWQFGTPGGASGDASSAYSGVNAFGNDLAIGNFNGAYQDDVHNYLRSPNFDLSSATGTRLRYRRWLTVEESQFDQARIAVNGVTVWTNPVSGNLIDTSWVLHEVDIAAQADGNPSVQIEFSLQSDGGLVFGGWTVDDIELVSIGPVSGGCTAPVSYGTAKQTSTGSFPFLGTIGAPSETAGTFTFELTDCVPSTVGLMFSSATSDSAPFSGGTRLVGFPIQREATFFTDVIGYATIPQAVVVGSSGTTRYYQAWFRDNAQLDGTGIGLSDALAVTFCD